MSVVNVKRFSFAVGASVALLYLGCVFIMATVPKEAAIRFFNSILHGIDVTTIIRWKMPWQEMVVGMLETFIIGWLFGALVAVLYNFNAQRDTDHGE